VRPLPLELEKSGDVTIPNNDESNAGECKEENKQNYFQNSNKIKKV
jgi:hypothetical protein